VSDVGQRGEIYWSPRAQRFYETGRRGAVSREQAIPSLSYDQEINRFRDTRGRLVPDRVLGAVPVDVTRFTARDAQGRSFISTEFVDRVVSRENAVRRVLAGNEQVVIRTVVRTPDGKVFTTVVSSKLGRSVDMEYLEQQANKRASAEARNRGYDISTPEVSQSTVTRDVIVRKVNVFK
jgi:hypothetical protein